MPRVSIIIRTKNRLVFLARSLLSIQQQGFKDWEAIIVNDGGDATALEQLLMQVPDVVRERLAVVHHETSQGRWAAANAGVKALAYIQAHKPDEIAAKMPPEYMGGDKNLTLEALTDNMGLFSKNGEVPQDGPATVQKVLANFDPKVKAANINLQDTYTNVYVQRAAALAK